MTEHTVTLNIPQPIYEQIQQMAETLHRPVDELLVETLIAVAPVINTTSQDIKSTLGQMAYLNDAALWQMARTTMPVEQKDRLEVLHIKQQQNGLTVEEQQEEQSLLRLYRETVLIRAQAAALLKKRGYDVADFRQFTPTP